VTVPPVARLRNARGSIREAFDELDTGVTFNDLIRYIERDFHAKAAQGVAADLDRLHARIVGLVAGAALTIVESDRRRRWYEDLA
jgi:Zn-dependent M16 (insulinase) family peptidase